MFFDELFRSLEPLRNPAGYGAADFIELAVAVVLVSLAYLFRRGLPALKGWHGMVLCALLPLGLRMLLLAGHPAPSPNLYDEFGHLLVADTLRHWRLANPPHPYPQFFETFFVLQSPTYSSIYPIGNGLAMAVGWALFGSPWAGVLATVSAFCALCYWMLRGWTTPGWALVGGLLAVMEFGPLNLWTNSYWGGAPAACAGCLVYGALPRLLQYGRVRDGILLGAGVGLHLLIRPYESIFLVVTAALFLRRAALVRPLAAGLIMLLPAVGMTLLHNKRVTGEWMKLPYALSQYQYGVPASLTFQQNPVPHKALTREQGLDYRMQREFHPGRDTMGSYVARLGYRIRLYRFYFYAPLYLALFAFLISIRTYREGWIAIACLIFAGGINFFPAFQFHYLAGVVCLFVLMSVEGLRRIADLPRGKEAAALIVFLCVAQFTFFYAMHLVGGESSQLDAWNSIDHAGSDARLNVNRQLAAESGLVLVFVRYWPSHVFQNEWVWNGADIDGQHAVWARDLGDEEDQKLVRYYGGRKPLLLEPDARPPRLSAWTPEPKAMPPEPSRPTVKTTPLLQLEQVR